MALAQSPAVQGPPFWPARKLNVTPNADTISNRPSRAGSGHAGVTGCTIRDSPWKAINSL